LISSAAVKVVKSLANRITIALRAFQVYPMSQPMPDHARLELNFIEEFRIRVASPPIVSFVQYLPTTPSSNKHGKYVISADHWQNAGGIMFNKSRT
jgi:hypothetical protein